MAVIDTLPAPPGWEDARAELIRIVDPLGCAVAWLDPGHHGRCVGYAVRRSGEIGTEWIQVFRPPGSDASSHDSAMDDYGVRGNVAAASPQGSQTATDAWRFIERDPTAATLACHLTDVDFAVEHGRDLNLESRFTVQLNQAALICDLDVENHTSQDVRLHVGMEIVLDAAPVRDTGGQIGFEIPGCSGPRPVPPSHLSITPEDTVKVGRAGLSMVQVDVELIRGVRHLDVLIAPKREKVVLSTSAAATESGGLLLHAGCSHTMRVSLSCTLESNAAVR